VGEYVSVQTDEEGVATIRLDRPPVNALDNQMVAEIAEAAGTVAADEHVASVVIWGGEKVFAAGADIKEMRERSFQDALRHSRRIQEAFRLVAGIPKVVIAAINGFALGGGCELALAADFRYAAEDARLGQPEIKLGLIPGAGGTQRLSRLVGVAKAKEMVYGGGMYAAADSLEMGLVDRVLPSSEVYPAAVEAARGYAKGPYALRLAKQAIDEGLSLDLESALRLETTLFAATFGTDDARTGMDSFLEHGPGKAEFRGN
jgi:enoyl-CoA hydratase/carnithine racemase